MSKFLEYLERVYEEGSSCGGKKPVQLKTKIKKDKNVGDKYETVEISSDDKKKRKKSKKVDNK